MDPGAFRRFRTEVVSPEVNLAPKLGKVLDWPSKKASAEEEKIFWRDEARLALLQAIEEGELGGGWAVVGEA